jgi:hypothetical protein
MADRSKWRGLPNTCCCPIVFGGRVTALHCPVHGPDAFGEDMAADAHAGDRRKRLQAISGNDAGEQR